MAAHIKRLLDVTIAFEALAKKQETKAWFAPAAIGVVGFFFSGGIFLTQLNFEDNLDRFSDAVENLHRAPDADKLAVYEAAAEARDRIASALDISSLLIFGGIVVAAISLALLAFAVFSRARHFQDANDNFAAVVKALLEGSEETTKGIQQTLNGSIRIADALQAIHEPWLIGWKRSSAMEKSAQLVRTLTPNLAWLTDEDHFDEIAIDLIRHPDNCYRYLVYYNHNEKDADDLLANLSKLKKFMQPDRLKTRYTEAAAAIGKSPDYAVERATKGIEVRLLVARDFATKCDALEAKSRTSSNHYVAAEFKSVDSMEAPFTPGEWRTNAHDLPLPGDLVLYRGVDLTELIGSAVTETAVLSRQPVNSQSIRKGETEKEFDLLLPEPEQVGAIRQWFSGRWDS